jgi:hypothetical protein
MVINKSKNLALITEFNENQILLKNWFIIVLYQVNCVLNYSEEQRDFVYHPEEIYKFLTDILIRHPIQTIFPCSSNLKQYLANIMNLKNDKYSLQIIRSSLDVSKQYIITKKFKKYSLYINILFSNNKGNNDNESMIFNLEQPFYVINSNLFPYDRNTKILYIEYRRLQLNLNEINNEINKNYITLDQLKTLKNNDKIDLDMKTVKTIIKSSSIEWKME